MKEINMIYLVDDNKEMRQSLSEALIRMGFEVAIFQSPVDFLTHIESPPSSPSALLLDMKMPQINGIKLQQILISKGMTIPIIFISGESHPQQIIDSVQFGAYRFFLKPFDLEELRDAINSALQLDKNNNDLLEAYRSLTPKEKEVFIALAEGKMLKQIAIDRSVSESVIKLHKSKVMHKLGVKSLQALALIYNSLNSQPGITRHRIELS